MMQISELYEKVRANGELQTEFEKIITGKMTNNIDEIREKLVAFAKEQGCDVTFEEIEAYFEDKANQSNEISEEELDMVAGGKKNPISTSVVGIAYTCVVETVLDWAFGDKVECKS